MLLYLVVTIWMLGLVVGCASLISHRTRFLFACIVFGSTAGTLGSLVAVTVFWLFLPLPILLVGWHPEGVLAIVMIGGGSLGGAGLGGFLGVRQGLRFARRFNARVGWQSERL